MTSANHLKSYHYISLLVRVNVDIMFLAVWLLLRMTLPFLSSCILLTELPMAVMVSMQLHMDLCSDWLHVNLLI